MRKFVLLAAVCAFAAPMPVMAQIERVDPDSDYPAEDATDDLAARLADPMVQEQLAGTVAALSDVLLDMPLAPIAKAMADAGVAAADEIPSNTTLRSMTPDAGRVSQEVADKLPAMMQAMASMAGAMREMAPMLEDMAARMKDTMPEMRSKH